MYLFPYYNYSPMYAILYYIYYIILYLYYIIFIKCLKKCTIRSFIAFIYLFYLSRFLKKYNILTCTTTPLNLSIYILPIDRRDLRLATYRALYMNTRFPYGHSFRIFLIFIIIKHNESRLKVLI